jgi:hypothetical protein
MDNTMASSSCSTRLHCTHFAWIQLFACMNFLIPYPIHALYVAGILYMEMTNGDIIILIV